MVGSLSIFGGRFEGCFGVLSSLILAVVLVQCSISNNLLQVGIDFQWIYLGYRIGTGHFLDSLRPLRIS